MRLVLDARTAAFARLFDDASILTPESATMADAVDQYRRLRSSNRRWAVGRLLCPASRLEELAAVATQGFTRGEQPWEIGVVFDVSTGAAASIALDFQTEMAPAMAIVSAETVIGAPSAETSDPRHIIDAVAAIDNDIAAFPALSTAGSIADQVSAISSALRRDHRPGGAAVRFDGDSEPYGPTVAEVAELIWEAALQDLPLRITTGLGGPIRAFDLAGNIWTHGVLNFLVASAAVELGEDRSVIERIVGESDPEAFSVGAAALSWRDMFIPGSALRRSRQVGLVSSGSRRIDMSMAYLDDIGYLGDGT